MCKPLWDIQDATPTIRLNTDTSTSMIWRAYPGFETEYSDYLDTLSLVDDAQPFDSEVQEIDFAKGGYSLTVLEKGEESEDDSSDEDDEEEGIK